MIAFEVETKVLDTEIIPQHTITDLNSGITFIVLSSQENPLRWKEINREDLKQDILYKLYDAISMSV